MVVNASAERAAQFERLALDWAGKAGLGQPGAAELAQAFATLAVAARLDHLQRRLSVIGDQLNATKSGLEHVARGLSGA
ncbi:hypothetical protein RND61_31140 [Streptomyces sp. TRM76323]|uniref:Uncharacterized protein n=1 Tax=Streptomyces tamarix TaxID=3078565 RepID=A0ABU3QUQ7_9ACTN|nr:hypothetical protein [Streptomyces tamarix]MDT9686487.1 hypothetical protein [Streptomyces tamarix]